MADQATEPTSPLVAVQDKRALFATVKTHPAWPHMLEHYRELRQRYSEALGAKLMAGDQIDQREIDFRRGYWAGVFSVLTSPEAAEKAYVQAQEKASRGRKDSDV
jgi:hypothetical protein